MVQVPSSIGILSGNDHGEAAKPYCFVEASLPNQIILRETGLMRRNPLDAKNDGCLRVPE
ncbi:hypothetical protein QUA71_09915 [Microcoleus sp. MON1_C5]|uniref:hypothetical protein n=1 Tax=Microcoleus sp. MON1_C5 TaxID=2818828 RepID=UPI002FD7240A